MSLVPVTTSGPLRVLISGGLAGPPGIGVGGAALDPNGHLVLSLSDGSTLPPVDLAAAVAAASITAATLTTISGDPITTLAGLPLQRIT